jgi:hypothetical protein
VYKSPLVPSTFFVHHLTPLCVLPKDPKQALTAGLSLLFLFQIKLSMK